jgi:hypothetical protein
MKSLLSEIVESLRNTEFDVSIPTNNIVSTYPATMPTFTQPYIFVSEIDNVPHQATYTHNEEYSVVSYQVEIYSKQQKIDNVIVSNADVVRRIGFKVNDVLCDIVGLRRTSAPMEIPYTYDNTVRRYILTFTGVLDLTHDKVYANTL